MPGMSGRAAKQKHLLMLKWAIVIGLAASALITGVLYVFNLPYLFHNH
jgi:hypothetical protein